MGRARAVQGHRYKRRVQVVRAMPTVEAFARARDEGRAMLLDYAARYALDEQAERGD
jgi:hypothetical protein